MPCLPMGLWKLINKFFVHVLVLHCTACLRVTVNSKTNRYSESLKNPGSSIYENRFDDEIRETLVRLRQQGKRVILVTAKPEFFAVRILEHS